MAKLFYSLEEASEKLGVSEEQLKQMASNRRRPNGRIHTW